VLSQPGEVPSASRTLGAAPFAYILAASGLWWLAHLRRPALPRWLGPAAAGVLVSAIVLLNAQRYFQDYIGGLPYQNTPIGRYVASYLDTLPPDTQLFMVGCCWEYAMPDPKSVQYVMQRPEQIQFVEPEGVTCDWLLLQPASVVLVWSFHDALPSPQLEACKAWLPAQLYVSKTGLPVFYAAPLRRELDSQPAASAAPAPADAQLETQLMDVDGQATRVRYSQPDIGEIGNIFDKNPETLMRGRDANPLIVDLEFAQPRELRDVSLTLASMSHVRVSISLTAPNDETTSFAREFVDLEGIPVVDLPIDGAPAKARRLRVEILDMAPRPDEGPHIHVRELRIQ
jgi:hypothetical protein